MPKKETDYEKLARQVAAGFRDTATEADLEALEKSLRADLVTKLDLKDALDPVLESLREIKKAVTWNEQEADDLERRWETRFRKLETRLDRLEKRP